MAAKSYVIALEEHYQDTELRQHTGGSIAERLEDVGALRLRGDGRSRHRPADPLAYQPGTARSRSRDRRGAGAAINDRLTKR